MVAKLKLKGIDGGAPQDVESQQIIDHASLISYKSYGGITSFTICLTLDRP